MMKLFWKGAVAVGLAITTLGATAAPVQAQHYRGGYDHRDYRDWRGDRYGDRRWDNRRDWRDNRRHWRDDRRGYYRHYRQRCWTEWRYNPYRDRNVRVRICR
ncbi:hypothetical protein FHS54_000637 [Sphingobium vermicomposti]|uniref:Uncharacterized protein n=2 Tax=Sphingobium vermicomposti TaxID=529005 RepID=A0A846M3L9_9SPHN|nr:hypothetical protein [Sphingobium vermicomposti]